MSDLLGELQRQTAYQWAHRLDAQIMDPHPFDGPFPPEPPSRRWVLFKRFDIIGADGSLYLRRWRLLETPWFGILLHKIARPDKDTDLHDHPWSFVSFVLWGWYVEQIEPRPPWTGQFVPAREHDEWITRAFHVVRWINARRAEGLHRISALGHWITALPSVWTLVFRGPRVRTWGFYTSWGSEGYRRSGWVPWHVYLGVTKKDESKSPPRPAEVVRHDLVDDRPIDEHAMEAVRSAPNPSHELDLAFAVLMRGCEVKRLSAAIRKHRDERGNDRCWLDDGELYAVLGEAQPDTSLPPEPEFIANCRQFHATRQAPEKRA